MTERSLNDAFDFDPLATAFLADPFPTFARARRTCPVYRHHGQVFQHTSLFLYEDVREALSNWKAFSSDLGDVYRDQMGGRSLSFLFSDPPVHTRLRTLVNQPFLPRFVHGLRPMLQQVTEQVFDEALARDEIDYMRDIADKIPVMALALLLGIPAEQRAAFKEAADTIGASQGFFTLGTELMSAEARARRDAAEQRLTDIYEPLLDERLQEPRDDLLSIVARAEREGVIVRSDIEGLILLMLNAGHGTTRRLIGNTVLELCRHPDQLDLLRRQPDLALQTVDEVLRHSSPVRLTVRRATASRDMKGVSIEKDEYLCCWIGSANRDESVFEDADRFDIRRDAGRSLAFGVGPHACLGRELGRVEGVVHLETLLRRVRRFDFVPGAPPRMVLLPISHGPSSLPLRVAAA